MRSSAHPSRMLAAVLVTAVGLTGCRTYEWPPEAASTPVTRPPLLPGTTPTNVPLPTSTTSTTTPQTTLRSVTTTTAPLPGLGVGARGAAVLALEERLAALRYDVGKVDDVFDRTTAHAVTAFQKVEGLARTSRATDDVLAALQRATEPAAALPTGGADRVEVDLKRQVLMLYRGGRLERILPISSGNGKRYCVDGECAKAVTPGGSFRVLRKISGLRVSRLGKLYNPLYFNGGIAIHGSPSVPAFPASHGCVRIPMSASKWFFDTVPVGTPVYVIGGPRAPVPFNEPTPGGPAPSDASTTTTSSTTTSTTVRTLLPPSSSTTTTTPSTSSTTTTSTPTTPTTAP